MIEIDGIVEKVAFNYYSGGTADTRITLEDDHEVWFEAVAPVSIGQHLKIKGKYKTREAFFKERHPSSLSQRDPAEPFLGISPDMWDKEIFEANEMVDIMSMSKLTYTDFS